MTTELPAIEAEADDPVIVESTRLMRSEQCLEALRRMRAGNRAGVHAAAAWAELGWRLRQTGNHAAEAEEAFRAALACQRDNRSANMGLSRLLVQLGRSEEAEALLAAVAIDALSAPAIELLGSLRMRRGDFEGGMAAMQAAIATGEASPGAEAALATCRTQIGRDADAFQATRAALEANPGDVALRAQLGHMLVDRGRYAEAAEHLAAALATGEAPPYARIRYAEALFRAERRAQGAVQARLALAEQPGLPPLMAHAAYLLRRSGFEEEAVALFAEAITLDPRAEGVRFLESASLFEERRPQEAMVSARRAAEDMPHSQDLASNLGHMLLACDRHDEAVDVFQTVIASSPDHLRAWTGLCEAERRRKRIKEALAAFRKVQSLNPDQPTLRHLRYQLFGEL